MRGNFSDKMANRETTFLESNAGGPPTGGSHRAGLVVSKKKEIYTNFSGCRALDFIYRGLPRGRALEFIYSNLRDLVYTV